MWVRACCLRLQSGSPERTHEHTQDDIVKDLEQPMISAKINGIKQAILLLLSGETMPR